MTVVAARKWLTTLALVIVALGTWQVAGPANAAPDEPSAQATLQIFHGEGCPHCAAELAFLAQLQERYPELVIERYEVWNNARNREVLLRTSERLGFEPVGVPVTVIDGQVWIGFDEATASQIEATVVAALARSDSAVEPPATAEPEGTPRTRVDVPFLGTVDLESTSLLAATVAIGFVDGVNPCSLWVLSVLLAIVLHSGSRGRVMTVGLLFMAVTAGMYGLYMFGLYRALDYVGSLVWIRLTVAVVALLFGLLQVKDGLAIGVGPSLSISPERRPELYRRMRRLAAADRSIPAVMAGTVVLAVGVSLLETPCTAGLPLLWTNLMAAQDVTTAMVAVLFAAYMLVFLLDELVVFAVAVVALRSTRIQERHGQALKLLAGSVMITLAGTMLVAPRALETLPGTLLVFGIAAVLTFALWLVARQRQSPAKPELTQTSGSRH